MLENCGYKIENVWCNRDGFAFGTKFTQCDPCQVDRPKESQKRHANGSNDERDYIAENIRAVRGVAKGICKPVKIVKTVKYRLVPLQGVTFGKPSSEHIPMELLLQYHYAREWFRDRDRQLCDRIKKMKQERPLKNRSTNSSRLRRHVESCKEKPNWLMKKFANMKVTHIDTFRSDKLREEAFRRTKKVKLPPLEPKSSSE